MPKTVLIVDDNEQNRKLARYALRALKYATMEALNGEEAVRMARDSKPDLILMDIRMPVMDGLQATKILKADASTSSIPVIAFTASVMKGDREKIIFEAGCDDYVSKPIDIKQFTGMARKYLEGK